MANTVSRYTGANPNGESDVMSRLTVTDASYFKLADITAADSYTLRLWIKASGSRTVLCYIGDTLYSIAATTAWKEIKHTAVVSSAGTCDCIFRQERTISGTRCLSDPQRHLTTGRLRKTRRTG